MSDLLYGIGCISLVSSLVLLAVTIYKCVVTKPQNKKWFILATLLCFVGFIVFMNIGDAVRIHDCNYVEVDRKEATCYKDGYVSYECDYFDCDRTKVETLEKLEHICTNWETTTPATCGVDGEQQGVCDNCGFLMTQTISKTEEHTWGDPFETRPDFEDSILREYRKCIVCGNQHMEEVSMPVDEMVKLLKDTCKAYTYKDIARYPDEYKGEMAVFTGEVVQVQESYGTTILRVAITKNGNDRNYYYSDTIYVTYGYSDGLRVLEDDVITMYGKLNGEKTYTSILDQSITLPSFDAYYAELS